MTRRRFCLEADRGTSQQTVLVIEDNEHVRCYLAELLVREGYLVLTAATARDALAMLRHPFTAIHLVILDVRLPDVSGTELCARLREFDRNLPVIVCTGEATPEDGGRLLGLGIHRYFVKPVSPAELLASVAAALP